MIRSMTGYGRGEVRDEKGRLIVEIKSVNSRFCEIILRSSNMFPLLENKIRKHIQSRVSRGRYEVFLSWEKEGEKVLAVRVDRELAKRYYKAAYRLKEELNLNGDIDLGFIAGLPEVIKVEEATVKGEGNAKALEQAWSRLKVALDRSLEALISMQEREGKVIEGDLVKRLKFIERLITKIHRRVPLMVDNYKKRLESRLRELLGDFPLDQSRLAMEVGIFLERNDITEELVRLNSHLAQFREILKKEEAIGRSLDFLTQEMYREINTIGSKASDSEISKQVVTIKGELEKIREQLQNVE